MNTILASSLPTKKFVDPDTISIPFHDIAHQNITTLLKTEGSWNLKQSVGPIGWRIRKHYFKVVHTKSSQKQSHSAKLESQASTSSYKEGSDQEFLASWTEYGQDKTLSDKEIQQTLKSLTAIQHPFIYPIEHIQSNENGCLIIRKFHKEGSLKDMLCNSQPLNTFAVKYGNAKGRSTLPLKDLAMYSRQILEGLKFLNSIRLPYGHLTAGNIFIENGVAKLSAIENFTLGLPSFYRPFFVQHSKISSMESIDVFTFGHVLFELQSTYSLQEPFVREISECPSSLKSLLESLITKDALKSNTYPTLDKLTMHPFFKEFVPSFDQFMASYAKAKPDNFNLPQKDSLQSATAKTEQRLKDEQKLVKSQKRIVRVQEKMTSAEEEKKKSNKQKLRSQNSMQQNGPINFKIHISESADEPEAQTENLTGAATSSSSKG